MAGITLVFLVFGVLASILVSQIDRQRYEASPTAFLARLIDEIATRYHVPREEAVQQVKSANDIAPFPVEIEILDHDAALKLVNNEADLPKDAYQVEQFGKRDALHYPTRLIRFAGSDEKYLSVNFRPRSSPLHRIFNPHSAVMMTSVFLASLFSMFLLFYSMRSKARLAADIINQIRGGDLSVRFPVGKMDEVGRLMVEFNKMADEIQRLVETIRNTELARMRRLQELAHDLRTPVASLKNLLETLQLHRTEMPDAQKEELLSLSLKEVDYFARLVEDLLFLAQVTEPKYSVTKSELNLSDLIEDEIETLKARYPKIEGVARFDRDLSGVKGDAHLLRRLFRNVLENAFSFARSKVEIHGKRNGVGITIVVRDDGQGFNETALAAFGEKRGTRVISNNSEARLSVGLGSVIMKAVVNLHGGALRARNREQGGAEIEVTLNDA